jgi:acyl-CoA thioesterase II
MSISVDDVLKVLDLEQAGEGRWQGGSVKAEGPVVFGGQLIGQAMVAVAAEVPGKKITSVHSTFARVGRTDQPITFEVDRFHDGRSMGSVTVTASQGERKLARSLFLLATAEDDLIKHASPLPAAAGTPETAHPQTQTMGGFEQRFVQDVDLFDVDAVGPAELDVWSRFDTARSEPVIGQALLVWASVSQFIGTAMRPHAGLGLARAHRDISTGVLSHYLRFHDEFSAGEWLLFALRSPYAGSGLAFGSAEVFTADGRLVASCVQESMIRPMVGKTAL